jgi:quercetin dioxygenase-like cupin family protein
VTNLHQHAKRCDWEDSVPLYVLGSLDDGDRIALEEHLVGGCKNCAAELFRVTDGLAKLAEASSVAMPIGSRERFVEGLSKSRAPQQQISPDASVILNESGVLISRSEAKKWQAVGVSGIWAKILFGDVERNSVTSLIRMDPGTSYPSHRHGGPEEIFLLSGEITLQGKLMKPGDYCHAEPGSIHGQSFTATGCVFILRASNFDEVLI